MDERRATYMVVDSTRRRIVLEAAQKEGRIGVQSRAWEEQAGVHRIQEEEAREEARIPRLGGDGDGGDVH